MDARTMLRRYLEQRRELGESELVLDNLHVDEVMRLLGAAGRATASTKARPSLRELASAVSSEDVQDWRTSHRDAGASAPSAAPAAPPYFRWQRDVRRPD